MDGRSVDVIMVWSELLALWMLGLPVVKGGRYDEVAAIVLVQRHEKMTGLPLGLLKAVSWLQLLSPQQIPDEGH